GSLVAAVLAHSGRLDKEHLGARVGRLSRRGEVCTMINKKYSEFLPSMQSAEELVAQVEGLAKNIDLLKASIENEVTPGAPSAPSHPKAGAPTPSWAVWSRPQTCQSSGSVWRALSWWGFVVSLMLEEFHLISNSLLELIEGLFLPLPAVSKSRTVRAGPHWSSLLLENLCLSLCSGQLLLQYILKPLISHPSLQPVPEEQPDVFILRFRAQEFALDESSPMEVFDKIKLVFEVLHKHLLNVPLDQPGEGRREGRVTLAELLGELIWEELSDCLIHNCLVSSIPTNSSKLEQYKEVIESTEEFERALKKMQFLKEDTTALLKYACNVDSHFANKKCQDVIMAARSLMTSEIHNTVKITPDSSICLPELPDPGSGDHLKTQRPPSLLPHGTVNVGSESRLSPFTLCLPPCRVSSSVQQLVELAYHTLLEATASTDLCCVQLFDCVRNIFQLFYEVVPTYHRENLQKLPQLAAIHHNNCMYISHHLLTLGHQFRYRGPGVLSSGAATFVDLVPGFRRLGMECFLAQMQVQKGEILERLSSARNFSNMDDEENYCAANKAIKQVLHQLRRLGMVWQDVLPVNVYCKAMGALLNTALAEIVTRIAALEDISAEDADRLYSLCRIMVEEGPQVFTPLLEEDKNKKYQEEVPVYVHKWMTFKGLMIILQANLQEIVDQWADGKGPLAEEFSAAEVKSLIRALFQNTERRAAALAKIK
ncbi:ZW10 protein, partial [Leiothrix lutea]|nr:ZW10 protein [Leiothrix lutea]